MGGLASRAKGISLPFMRRKKPVFERRHSRYQCCIVAEADLVDRGFALEGAVMEVSLGGVLFRPANVYILDRRGEAVRVRFEHIVADGVIANVRPQGYGVRLFKDIDEQAIDKLVEEYGLVDQRQIS
ncbi:MAG: PilZ domain-containing protein [Hyphomicrobiales bacterium]